MFLCERYQPWGIALSKIKQYSFFYIRNLAQGLVLKVFGRKVVTYKKNGYILFGTRVKFITHFFMRTRFVRRLRAYIAEI